MVRPLLRLTARSNAFASPSRTRIATSSASASRALFSSAASHRLPSALRSDAHPRTATTVPAAPRMTWSRASSHTAQAAIPQTPDVKVTAAAPGQLSGVDAAIVAVVSSEGSPELVGNVDSVNTKTVQQLKKLGFKGKAQSTVIVPGGENDPAPVLLFVGLGEQPENGFKPETLRRAAGVAVRAAGAAELKNVAVIFPAETPEAVVAVAEGASLGTYTWNQYKTEKSEAGVQSIQVVTKDEDAVRRAEIAARHTKRARDLVNTPPNFLYPATFAEQAQKAAKGLDNVTVEVWDEKKLKDERMGGILGVCQGSQHTPRLVKISYAPSGASKKLSIVGKGITFDSGGISLKPSKGMHEMKGDMGGAAATLHAVLCAAELKLPVNVTGFLCLAENMPSGSALKNGDVITQRTGTTVQILNTDAEGRLVLADGLAVAQSKETGYGTEEADPDLLLDIATLTGAQMAALGTRTAGLMGDDKAVEAVRAASGRSGEQFWAMPFPDEMLEDLKSTTADLDNIGSVPWGGMLKAGIFVSKSMTREARRASAVK